MAPHVVPPEVARRIVSLIENRQTLTVMARTTRTLQNAAEKRIYEFVEMIHHPLFLGLCEVLATCPRIAAHVRSFILSPPGPAHFRMLERDRLQYEIQRTVESPEYWNIVHKALANLQSLDCLCICDPTLEYSWVLVPTEDWALRAADARLYLPWDENVVAFLETQDRLRTLFVADVAENVPLAPLSGSALPNLTHFEGPLMLVDQLLHCPITHLKFPIDSEDALSLLPLVLPELSRFKKLKSLSIATIPHEMLLSSVAALSLACPRLKYLSHIPLPMEHKTRLKLLQHLSRFSDLDIVEIDIAHWNPPLLGPSQRIFAVELRMIIPSLKFIFFWNRHDRWMWIWSPEEVETSRGIMPDSRDATAAGAAAAAAAATNVEEQSYVGLEGWKHSWSQMYYANQSSTWKSIA
ncbi:hypothetical protein M0805_000652 [Coniferiporia weirii]|nr:hypothetical protein M0805_000652 [Coniferiporia weirii]